MRTAQEIYDAYDIPPWLQMHQLRVAAVGESIVRCYPEIASDDVIAACLLHDAGAIVKFDFSTDSPFAKYYTEEESRHWQAVQERFRTRYAIKEHDATDAVIVEIGVRESVRSIVHNTGFANMERMISGDMIAVMIVQYADMRVSPTGITSLEERLADVKVRYKEHLQRHGWYERYDLNIAHAKMVEERLFRDIALRPENITDESLAAARDRLRQFPLLP